MNVSGETGAPAGTTAPVNTGENDVDANKPMLINVTLQLKFSDGGVQFNCLFFLHINKTSCNTKKFVH